MSAWATELIRIFGAGEGHNPDNFGIVITDVNGTLQILDEEPIKMIYDPPDTEGLYPDASSALNTVAVYKPTWNPGSGEVIGAYRYQTRLFSKK